MIRLWNRVGWYRALAVLLLLGAVASGVAIAANRQSPQPAAASSTAARPAADNAAAGADRSEQKELAELRAERAEAERAARRDAQRKADEAAAAASQQAKSASPTPKTTKSAPPKPNLPIPASCAEYSGNRAIGCALLLASNYGLDQMPCLDKLWTKESGWNHLARNKSSGAGGIPQALPASKMASAGSDWATNPATQIKWGLGYIKDRYSTPCGAWAHFQSKNWY